MAVSSLQSQSEFAVPYDNYNMKFGSVKDQGRYTTGVGVSFYRFQRTLQDLKVGKIVCLSTDKIEIELDVKIQIRMLRDSLIPLVLRQFSNADSHMDFLKHLAQSTLVSTCLEYKVDQYFTERSNVDRRMFNNLQAGINNNDFGANVEFFQLTHIQLPESLTRVITEKQNIEQEIITAQNDRANQIIQANTDFLEAQQKAQVILIEANNTAAVLTNQAEVQQQIIIQKWANLGEAYVVAKDLLRLNVSGYLDYLGAELYRVVNQSVVN